MPSPISAQAEAQLAEAIAEYWDDPLGWVMFSYPWGLEFLPDKTLNPLRYKMGPETWQRDLLIAVGEHIKDTGIASLVGMDMKVWRSAIASGHGVGKSAVVAWLCQFFMSTRRDTRGVVTANTQTQLETKTWPELAKWHNLLINKHWFTWTATSYYFALYPEDRRKNYMLTATTVSENNTEAFAGLHNEAGTVINIFDEASGIHEKVWEVATGAFTDGEGFFFAFGNPTRPDGEFANCFDKNKDKYYTANVDARTVSHTNKTHLQDIIDMYGEDDDRTKIRVYGQFPTQAYNGFITMETVLEAINRPLEYDGGAPIIVAVDVARFGGDEIVIRARQGRDARSFPVWAFRKMATTRTAERVIEYCNRIQPDAVVIEGTGVGAGVIDILRDRNMRIIEINPGSPATEPKHHANKRAELWSLMNDWLIKEGCIADDPQLTEQLTKIQYAFDRQEQRIIMEPKEAYKTRTGLSSPDRADTLALTFGIKLARRDSNLSKRAQRDNRVLTQDDPLDAGHDTRLSQVEEDLIGG